jgi:hypothetical protein
MRPDFTLCPVSLPNMQHYFQQNLTRNNYLVWCAQFLPYLKAHCLLVYIDDNLLCSKPTSSEDLYAYSLMHEMCLEQLFTSLDLLGSFANAFVKSASPESGSSQWNTTSQHQFLHGTNLTGFLKSLTLYFLSFFLFRLCNLNKLMSHFLSYRVCFHQTL